MTPPTATRAARERPEPNRADQARTTPFLEYYPGAGCSLQRIALHALPFRLGRTAPAHFLIPCGQISRAHAEIYGAGHSLRLRDLGSTNGTFVNGRRVADAELQHGDIVNLASRELRFLADEETAGTAPLGRTAYLPEGVPQSVLHGLPLLQELLRGRLVRTAFQPILDLGTGLKIGYEALGRGTHDELSPKPADLFRLADRCGVAVELSRLLRAVAVEEARHLAGRPALFLNVHPAELRDPGLLPSLRELRNALPAEQPLVAEIHEDTVTDTRRLRAFRDGLHDAGLLLAFDDIGTGQSRLSELAGAPPDLIKLNISLIRDVHRSDRRRKLLATLTRAAHDLGIQVLAGGVEVREEAEMCRELGCGLGQGFFYGRPEPVTGAGPPSTLEIDLPPRASARPARRVA